MKIEAYYLDGRFETYDTESHFNASGSVGDSNCMVMYAVHGDVKTGLWVRYSAYDVSETMQMAGRDNPCPPLRGRVDVQVLDAEDMDGIAWVAVDGLKRYFRLAAGQPLIDGFKFDTNHEIFVGSRESAAIREKTYDLYRVLRGGAEAAGALSREPHETDEAFEARVAEMMGWDARALSVVVAEEELKEWQEDSYDAAGFGGPERMAEELGAACRSRAAGGEEGGRSEIAEDNVDSKTPTPVWSMA